MCPGISGENPGGVGFGYCFGYIHALMQAINEPCVIDISSFAVPHRKGALHEQYTTEFNVPCGQRQLFLDDVGIERLENLTRTLHQPTKKGAVARSANPTQTIQTRTAPAWDPEEEVYKLWVIGTDESYRVSADGLHWTPRSEPNIGGPMAVRDGNDPDPGRRYKAALLNAGFAVSPDGVNWTKLDVPPVPSSDEGNFSYSEQEGLFIHTVKRSGPYGRSLALATSIDFEHWDDYGLVFHADELDQEMGRDVIEGAAHQSQPSSNRIQHTRTLQRTNLQYGGISLRRDIYRVAVYVSSHRQSSYRLARF